MFNLQLIDSLEGGYFSFERNNYSIDQGIYTEMYVALFGTSSAEWWGDGALGTTSFNISSETGIALKNNNSTQESDINLIKKAINNDLDRFTTKNNEIEIKGVEVAFWSKTILIIIELTGYNDSFNFIYQKTKESLDNASFKTY
jgi:hypothetical protein